MNAKDAAEERTERTRRRNFRKRLAQLKARRRQMKEGDERIKAKRIARITNRQFGRAK